MKKETVDEGIISVAVVAEKRKYVLQAIFATRLNIQPFVNLRSAHEMFKNVKNYVFFWVYG